MPSVFHHLRVTTKSQFGKWMNPDGISMFSYFLLYRYVTFAAFPSFFETQPDCVFVVLVFKTRS